MLLTKKTGFSSWKQDNYSNRSNSKESTSFHGNSSSDDEDDDVEEDNQFLLTMEEPDNMI